MLDLSNDYMMSHVPFQSISVTGGGQECCYNAEGSVINVALSNGGGFSHRYHHDGVPPYGEPYKVYSRPRSTYEIVLQNVATELS